MGCKSRNLVSPTGETENPMGLDILSRALLRDGKARSVPAGSSEVDQPNDRSSVYRNLETLRPLKIIQEPNRKNGKVSQYLLGRKISHFSICKS